MLTHWVPTEHTSSSRILREIKSNVTDTPRDSLSQTQHNTINPLLSRVSGRRPDEGRTFGETVRRRLLVLTRLHIFDTCFRSAPNSGASMTRTRSVTYGSFRPRLDPFSQSLVIGSNSQRGLELQNLYLVMEVGKALPSQQYDQQIDSRTKSHSV